MVLRSYPLCHQHLHVTPCIKEIFVPASPALDARKSSSYIPTLDGWRAISILLVMAYHDSIHTLGHHSTRWFFHHGQYGVDIFFAISGLLICSRLLDEEARHGAISLRHFYIRRAFRILPPAMLYLLVIALLSSLAIIPRIGSEWFGALFFYRNYTHLFGSVHPVGYWFTIHFWSLSVEEHFYFLLPGILVLTRRRYRFPVILAFIGLIALRLVLSLHHRPWDVIFHHTDIILDSLLIPALFAILLRKPAFWDVFRRIGLFWPLIIALIFTLLTWTPDNAPKVLALTLLTPLMVLSSVLHPDSILGRFLEWSPLRYIGRISYSLYIWQMLFFVGHDVQPAVTLGFLQSAPFNYLATFLCAIASYTLLEKPAIHLGHQISNRFQRTPNAAIHPATNTP